MSRPFAIDLGWAAVLHRLEISPDDLLRAAGLRADLFQRDRPTLDTDAFLRLWSALEDLLDNPAPGLLLGKSVQAEAFNPPLFAAFCSPNLTVALQRLSQFKPLLGPFHLDVTRHSDGIEVAFGTDDGVRLPPEFIAAELVFLVSLARLATRSDVRPTRVEMVEPPLASEYTSFFGIAPRKGRANRLRFTPRDAARPFLSANPAMFAVFEPELRLRLGELSADVSLTDRLRAALMEALPASRTAIANVAPRLGLSPRSLQRKLGALDTSYQAELTALRTRLATDYLRNTAHSSSEISFLLGYSDPNSFTRAFHGWTGTTPETMRKTVRQ